MEHLWNIGALSRKPRWLEPHSIARTSYRLLAAALNAHAAKDGVGVATQTHYQGVFWPSVC